MRDSWYADNRDLIKWGVLFRLAERFAAGRILQLAFLRPSQFGELAIDGQAHPVPAEVIAHFRNLRMVAGIGSNTRVTVFDPPFEGRDTYLRAVLALLPAYAEERCLVFLDPDTGLESQNPSSDHVLDQEAAQIWKSLKSGDVFILYQHQTNRAGKPWIDPKRIQLANALQVQADAVKVAHAPRIANDVVLFFIQKITPGDTERVDAHSRGQADEQAAPLVLEAVLRGKVTTATSVEADDQVSSGHVQEEGRRDIESRVLKLTDEGLVHGGEPENSWLTPFEDYQCETLAPRSGHLFTLTYNVRTSGGRAWDCKPKIRRLLETLDIAVVGHLSKRNPVELWLRVRLMPAKPAID